MWEEMLQPGWSCFASCKRCGNLKYLSSYSVFEDKITGEESTEAIVIAGVTCL